MTIMKMKWMGSIDNSIFCLLWRGRVEEEDGNILNVAGGRRPWWLALLSLGDRYSSLVVFGEVPVEVRRAISFERALFERAIFRAGVLLLTKCPSWCR